MSLERDSGRPPRVAPSEEPPETTAGREERAAEGERDMRPAIGSRGAPATWAAEGDEVALQGDDFGDAQWSFLYKSDGTRYAAKRPAPGALATANRRMRSAPVAEVHGPFVKGPVWTWEVPVYLWIGGIAVGASFVALACDTTGDRRSARLARKVALAAAVPAPLLLISDLGRPRRFLNMLRVFKPRSPMNMGAWCLVAFSSSTAGAVTADLLDRRRAGRTLGAVSAILGGYHGSYTGVLLAATAVPVWAQSRLLLGPIFVATTTATGAAAVRLALVGRGLPRRHPSRDALASLETASMLAELALSAFNERRIGSAAEALETGTAGKLYRTAKWLVAAGVSTRLVERRTHRHVHDLASVLYLASGLAFRFAWVYAGKASAAQHDAAAALGRARLEQSAPARARSIAREPGAPPRVRRVWSETLRRVSLALERAL